MSQLLEAFILGNSAILTNVCILPLYPGLIAFMAGNAANERAQKATRWLGLLVLAGVLTLMILVGAILYYLQQSFGAILPVLLPVIYAAIILLGVLMLFGRNPFNRLTTMQTPALSNPYVAAYVYGLLLGPMTLPCAGPIILSAFLLGAGSFAALGEGLAFFLAFGLGFGWPLVLLPFLAIPFQRRFTRWMTQHYGLLTRVSGVLLVAIGLLGIFTDLLPQL
ncbi:MAG: cytochrome c biogenesis protein CcdA [Anaerolineae bacterium]|jgi:cytochrome c-type biogenesis protein